MICFKGCFSFKDLTTVHKCHCEIFTVCPNAIIIQEVCDEKIQALIMQRIGKYVRIPTLYGMAFVGSMGLVVANKIKGLGSKPDTKLWLLKL